MFFTCAARVNRLRSHFAGGRRPVVRENVGEIRVLKRRRTAIVAQIRRVRGRRQRSGERRAPRVGESCKKKLSSIRLHRDRYDDDSIANSMHGSRHLAIGI